ncbi:MAG: hypothetical protein L6R38_009307 [Xanthoria sp. 2 TBL-2021]|nr:MAG: hypothetical protein L6R38_009307 [Xanthoria sp. 2 TBL-2021]
MTLPSTEPNKDPREVNQCADEALDLDSNLRGNSGQESRDPLQGTTTKPGLTSSPAGHLEEEKSFGPSNQQEQENSGNPPVPNLWKGSGSNIPGRREATSSEPTVSSQQIVLDPMPSVKEPDDQGSDLQSLVSAQRRQPYDESNYDPEDRKAATVSAIRQGESVELTSGTALPPDTTAPQQEHRPRLTFRMVLYKAKDETAQRMAYLDTGSTVDLMSIDVVNSLNLRKDPYQGPPLKPMGGFFMPQWQVTADWHVAKFHKTYTTTFVVMDEKYSIDYDVLLGRSTIGRIGFVTSNNEVYFMTTEGEYRVLEAVDASDDSFPANGIKIDTN